MTDRRRTRRIVARCAEFAACDDPAALENAKARYLGKSGALTEQLKALGKLSAAERPAAGARINEAKAALEEALGAAARSARRRRSSPRSSRPKRSTCRCPDAVAARAALHPLTRTLERVETLFRSLGFEVADGPEIEDDFHNFTALNTPENHPARSMHDTFYVDERAGAAHAHVADPGALHGERTRRRSRSSRRVASIASTATRRTRRCSTRSKGLWIDERRLVRGPEGRRSPSSCAASSSATISRCASGRRSFRSPSRRRRST